MVLGPNMAAQLKTRLLILLQFLRIALFPITLFGFSIKSSIICMSAKLSSVLKIKSFGNRI